MFQCYVNERAKLFAKHEAGGRKWRALSRDEQRRRIKQWLDFFAWKAAQR